MLIEKFVDKFKDVLTEEDLVTFKTDVNNFLTEEAQKRADLIVEEKTKEIQEATEKYIVEAKEEIKNELMEDYDLKMEQLEEKMVATLDQLIDQEISNNISDEILTKVAINETLEPVVDGIKKVFSNNLIELDVEGDGVISKLKLENENLQKELSESIADKMVISEEKKSLEDTLEKISVKSLISEKVEGLSDTQKERIVNLFENKKFDDVKSNIDSMIEQVISEENKTDEKTENEIIEGDGIKEEKPVIKESYSAATIAKNLI
jgi:hypothetical protein